MTQDNGQLKAQERSGEAMAKAITELAQAQVQQTQAILKAITAPKKVIRDPATNRAVGVETVVH